MELREFEGTLEECEKHVNGLLEEGHKARIIHMRSTLSQQGLFGSGTGYVPEKVMRWGIVVELR